ncbi:hypothetical protein [Dyadobacter sp. 32]|uniref:hypothetical protein n=1 Tax=Dyadobacter sp. 32 TaxID=538966 RepID=UPI0039C6EB51
MNNPLKYTDPDGNFWFISPQIGFGKGGFSLGLEIGIGFKGFASISVSAGYNFKSDQGYWSVQGSALGIYAGYGSSGWFAGAGLRHPSGVSLGWGYSQAGGWNAGIGFGRNAGNFSGAAGIGWSENGGFDWGVSAGYSIIFDVPVQELVVQGGVDGSKTLAERYNSSPEAEFNDQLLEERMKSDYGVSVGTFGIQEITTKTGDRYTMNSSGTYQNRKGKTVAGYYSRQDRSLHVSPMYTNATDVLFRATAGHELIHAFHHYKFGVNMNARFSERVAYQYSYNVYMRAGLITSALGTLSNAASYGYWGYYPSGYKYPNIWKR